MGRALDTPTDRLAFEIVAELAEIDVDQIRRAAVDRHLIAGARRARSGDFRFIIACGEGGASTDLGGLEIAGEEICCGFGRPA